MSEESYRHVTTCRETEVRTWTGLNERIARKTYYNIRTLALHDLCLTTQHASWLFNVIGHLGSLTTVSLKDLHLGHSGIKQLFEALTASTAHIQIMCLSGNDIEARTGQHVARFVRHRCATSLGQLDLSHNNLEAQGAADVLRSLTHVRHSTHVDMSHNKITFVRWKDVARAVAVRSLRLDGNNLLLPDDNNGKFGVVASKWQKGALSVASVHVHGPFPPQLAELLLTDCNLNVKAGCELCANLILPVATTLTTFIVDHNVFTDDVLKPFVAALAPATNLSTVSLGANLFTDIAVPQLAKLMTMHKHLTAFDVRCNRLHLAGCLALCTTATRCTELGFLNLAGNMLTIKDCDFVYNAVRNYRRVVIKFGPLGVSSEDASDQFSHKLQYPLDTLVAELCPEPVPAATTQEKLTVSDDRDSDEYSQSTAEQPSPEAAAVYATTPTRSRATTSPQPPRTGSAVEVGCSVLVPAVAGLSSGVSTLDVHQATTLRDAIARDLFASLRCVGVTRVDVDRVHSDGAVDLVLCGPSTSVVQCASVFLQRMCAELTYKSTVACVTALAPAHAPSSPMHQHPAPSRAVPMPSPYSRKTTPDASSIAPIAEDAPTTTSSSPAAKTAPQNISMDDELREALAQIRELSALNKSLKERDVALESARADLVNARRTIDRQQQELSSMMLEVSTMRSTNVHHNTSGVSPNRQRDTSPSRVSDISNISAEHSDVEHVGDPNKKSRDNSPPPPPPPPRDAVGTSTVTFMGDTDDGGDDDLGSSEEDVLFGDVSPVTQPSERKKSPSTSAARSSRMLSPVFQNNNDGDDDNGDDVTVTNLSYASSGGGGLDDTGVYLTPCRQQTVVYSVLMRGFETEVLPDGGEAKHRTPDRVISVECTPSPVVSILRPSPRAAATAAVSPESDRGDPGTALSSSGKKVSILVDASSASSESFNSVEDGTTNVDERAAIPPQSYGEDSSQKSNYFSVVYTVKMNGFQQDVVGDAISATLVAVADEETATASMLPSSSQEAVVACADDASGITTNASSRWYPVAMHMLEAPHSDSDAVRLGGDRPAKQNQDETLCQENDDVEETQTQTSDILPAPPSHPGSTAPSSPPPEVVAAADDKPGDPDPASRGRGGGVPVAIYTVRMTGFSLDVDDDTKTVAVVDSNQKTPHDQERRRNASSSSPGDGAASPNAYLDRVRRFYLAHNPSKVGDIPKIMRIFRGREEELMENLIAKYGPEPNDDGETPAPSPSPAPKPSSAPATTTPNNLSFQEMLSSRKREYSFERFSASQPRGRSASRGQAARDTDGVVAVTERVSPSLQVVLTALDNFAALSVRRNVSPCIVNVATDAECNALYLHKRIPRSCLFLKHKIAKGRAADGATYCVTVECMFLLVVKLRSPTGSKTILHCESLAPRQHRYQALTVTGDREIIVHLKSTWFVLRCGSSSSTSSSSSGSFGQKAREEFEAAVRVMDTTFEAWQVGPIPHGAVVSPTTSPTKK
eukprot:PhM_4_TR8300/c0_g1_i4/m.57982